MGAVWIAKLTSMPLTVVLDPRHIAVPPTAASSQIQAKSGSKQGSEWTLDLVATSDGVHDSGVISARLDATNGYDPAYDFPTAPPPPTSRSASVSVIMDLGLVTGKRFNAIGEPVLSDGEHRTYEIELRSRGLTGSAMTVSWSPPNVPHHTFMLTDKLSGTTIDMQQDTTYTYRVEDSVARFLLHIEHVGSSSVHRDTEELPADVVLAENYPNPFNPITMIPFTLSEHTQVRLAVYDVLGRELQVLVDGIRSAGSHTAMFEAVNLPSGTYFYRLEARGQVLTRKLTLLK